MNRTFMTKLTPARARLLLTMAKHTNVEIDERILDVAEQDRIADSALRRVGITDADEAAAVQFIHDTNFRAGIPTANRDRDRANRIVSAVLKLGHFPTDDVVCLGKFAASFSEIPKSDAYDDITDFDYDTLAPLRKRLLLLNLDDFDERTFSADLIGKMFSRIIAIGSMTIQYSFAFGATNSTTSRMGKLLYPQVEDSVKSTTWKASERRSVVAMGVFPDLLPNQADIPKQIAGNFIVPRTIEY